VKTVLTNRSFRIAVFPMLTEMLQDRAALYVSGAMTAAERENFELVLEFHAETRAHVAGLQRIGASVAVATMPPVARPPAQLRSRVLAALADHPQRREPDAVVVTGGDGCIEWVNPAFLQLCGYAMCEVQGRRPGKFLQGPATDQAAVQRIRSALARLASCRETLVNYHKDGTPYAVEIAIAPVLDDDGQPLWFVARERRSAGLAAPV
jgi:PAS domain S-box-containing protein